MNKLNRIKAVLAEQDKTSKWSSYIKHQRVFTNGSV